MRRIIAILSLLGCSTFVLPALAGPQYPMDADEYQEVINRRIESTWTRIEKKLIYRKVSEERRNEIRRVFDEAASAVTDALERASQDGKISRGEAYRINLMTSALRGKLRGKLAVDRSTPNSQKVDPDTLDSNTPSRPPAEPKTRKEPSAQKQKAGKAPSQSKSEQANPNKGARTNTSKAKR